MSNIKYELMRELEQHISLGVSKRACEAETGKSEFIHSASTARSYMQQVGAFGIFLRDIGQNKCSIEESKKYAADFVQSKNSAWSQALSRSALAKVYNCNASEICTIEKRGKDDITRGRSMTERAISIEKNHPDIVKFCKSTGLRKDRELANLKMEDIKITDKITISVTGKGGRHRFVEVLPQNYEFCKDFILNNLQNPSDKLKLYHGMNCHKYRADFAKDCYNFALENYATGELYHPKKDSRTFDKGALNWVNRQLGHGDGRYYTAVANYLYE